MRDDIKDIGTQLRLRNIPQKSLLKVHITFWIEVRAVCSIEAQQKKSYPLPKLVTARRTRTGRRLLLGFFDFVGSWSHFVFCLPCGSVIKDIVATTLIQTCSRNIPE